MATVIALLLALPCTGQAGLTGKIKSKAKSAASTAKSTANKASGTAGNVAHNAASTAKSAAHAGADTAKSVGKKAIANPDQTFRQGINTAGQIDNYTAVGIEKGKQAVKQMASGTQNQKAQAAGAIGKGRKKS